jgi:hypothetical protein
MKKNLVVIITIFGFLLVTWLPCQGQQFNEYCWELITDDENCPCIVRLQVSKEGIYYSVLGKQICIDNGVKEIDFLYGSGYIVGNKLMVGLTATSVEPTTYNPVEMFHGGSVFAMNLSGLKSIRYLGDTGNPDDFGTQIYNRITCPSVELTSPDGGETLTPGIKRPITWTTTSTIVPKVAKVILSYSIDGGNTWTKITTLTGNPESYNWTVPNGSFTTCKVKVVLKDSGGATVGSDLSDGFFTIQP